MTEVEIKRIVETLSQGKNKYYVYTLRDTNNIPFYVGKGCGNRLLQHNKQAMSIKSLLEDDPQITISTREKIEKLIQLNNNTDFYHIEKYGLSEYEAFMCESILINYIESIGIKLTNVVNGHASESEKNSLSTIKTKSRSLSEFLTDVAIPEIDISEIKYNVAFVKVNKSFDCCVDENNIVDKSKLKSCVSGCWHIGRDKLKRIKYVLALYKQKVVGIYNIKSISNEINIEYKNTNLLDFPTFPFETRKIDIWKAKFDSIEQAEKTLNNDDYKLLYDTLLQECKNKSNLINNRLKYDQKRRYFVLEENNIPNDLLNMFNCIIINNKDPNFFKTRHSLRFN